MTDNDQRVLIELDARGRASLARLGRPEHRRYLARIEADGTIILTPATVVPVIERLAAVDPRQPLMLPATSPDWEIDIDSGKPDTWHGLEHRE
jgi:hypothetical protein